MTTLKLIILVLFTGNVLLLGLEASKPPAETETQIANVSNEYSDIPVIRLLGELNGAGPGASGGQCFTIGPFEAPTTVEAITEMLGPYTTSVSHRVTEAFVDRGYWVYLPPYENEQGAREAVDVLYNAGLDDVSLIRNGELDNSVSLGYFVNQSNARQRRDSIRELGFPAEFRIQREDESRYWVDYQQQAGAEYASRMLVDIVPAELHRSTACSDSG